MRNLHLLRLKIYQNRHHKTRFPKFRLRMQMRNLRHLRPWIHRNQCHETSFLKFRLHTPRPWNQHHYNPYLFLTYLSQASAQCLKLPLTILSHGLKCLLFPDLLTICFSIIPLVLHLYLHWNSFSLFRNHTFKRDRKRHFLHQLLSRIHQPLS